MRILLTTDTVGGVWTFTCELTRMFLAQGNQVVLVSLGGPPSATQQAWCTATQQTNRNNFHYRPLDIPLEWMQNNADVVSTTRDAIEPIVSSFRPDVIHANQFCLGKLQCDAPVLVTVHSDVFSWAEACKPEGLEASSWLARYRDVATQGMETAALLVAPTQWMADATKRLYRLQREIRVIANGRSLGLRASGAKKLQAVTAGRFWDPGKGLEVLSGLTATIPIYIAGSLQEDQQADKLSCLPAGASLLGALPESALMALFAESAIYLATSIYEPFGLAPLEAALSGCAVLARDIPSLREVWGPGALYFRDTASLDVLLAELLRSAEHLKAAQQRSVARAERYTATAMAEHYLAAYEELLALPQTATPSEAIYAR